jgi:hypothetical protein
MAALYPIRRPASYTTPWDTIDACQKCTEIGDLGRFWNPRVSGKSSAPVCPFGGHLVVRTMLLTAILRLWSVRGLRHDGPARGGEYLPWS